MILTLIHKWWQASGLVLKIMQQICCHFATVCWQQLSVGNNNKKWINVIQTLLHFSSMKSLSLLSNERNATSLFLSKFVSLKRRRVLLTWVSFVNMTWNILLDSKNSLFSIITRLMVESWSFEFFSPRIGFYGRRENWIRWDSPVTS